MPNIRRSYFLLILLLMFSGTPCFSMDSELALLLFVFLVYNINKDRIKISFKSIGILALFLSVIILRGIYRDTFAIYDFSQLIIFIDIFLIVYLVKNDFLHCYVNIMKWSALISIVLWGAIQLSGTFYNVLLSFAEMLPQFGNTAEYMQDSSNPSYSLYVFTVSLRDYAIERNSGFTYEPGLYAVYITLALVIHLMSNGINIYSKVSILFLLTIISTFSTAGYASFTLIIILAIIFSRKINALFKILMCLLIPSIVGYIFSLEFMSEKISTNIELDGNTQSRFYAIIYHWEMIKETSYIIGCYYRDTEISPNGLTMVLLRWGIPISIVYYILLFKGLFSQFREKNIIKKTLYILPILVVVFSQVATVYPLFYAIVMMGCIDSNKGISMAK
ncbi:MAG: hypothetical protein J6C80_05435 [Flavobacteriales bacterium]|nr:hypothetical protein [Flavobacteriales bacterium]